MGETTFNRGISAQRLRRVDSNSLLTVYRFKCAGSELEALYTLTMKAKKRFLETAKAEAFPFFFRDMPELACNEETVEKFLSLKPCCGWLRESLEKCQHPVMLRVFDHYINLSPSEEEKGFFKKNCGKFLAAFPEAAERL